MKLSSEDVSIMSPQMRKLFGLVAGGPVTKEYSGGGVMAGNSTVVMVRYCTVLYCTVLYCTVLYCTVLW